jgi:hypothetical protein
MEPQDFQKMENVKPSYKVTPNRGKPKPEWNNDTDDVEASRFGEPRASNNQIK